MMRVPSATAGDTVWVRYARMSAWASCAWADVATLPVPMAQTGSYAITTLLYTRPSASRHAKSGEARHARPVGLFEELRDGRELGLHDLRSLARLALGERLTDAEDHREPVVERDTSLLCDELGRLVEECAPLRVS